MARSKARIARDRAVRSLDRQAAAKQRAWARKLANPWFGLTGPRYAKRFVQTTDRVNSDYIRPDYIPGTRTYLPGTAKMLRLVTAIGFDQAADAATRKFEIRKLQRANRGLHGSFGREIILTKGFDWIEPKPAAKPTKTPAVKPTKPAKAATQTIKTAKITPPRGLTAADKAQLNRRAADDLTRRDDQDRRWI